MRTLLLASLALLLIAVPAHATTRTPPPDSASPGWAAVAADDWFSAGTLVAGADGRLSAAGFDYQSGRQLWAYDPAADAWQSLPTLPGPPRAGAAVAAGPDGRIYVMGGGSERMICDC